ncbi:hypothetical protein Q3G72_032714 [Acer saccharum]|nr:hypothetical protein Q3G72_032714 [Acer saccharum]
MKSNEGSKGGEGGSISLRPGSLASLKGGSGSDTAALTVKITETLDLDGGSGAKADEMCVDGSGVGPIEFNKKVGLSEVVAAAWKECGTFERSLNLMEKLNWCAVRLSD